MDLLAPSHLVILMLIVLTIFGPGKLGEVGGVIGKVVRDFRKAVNETDKSKWGCVAAGALTSRCETRPPLR